MQIEIPTWFLDMQKRNTFAKKEHLCGEKETTKLYEEGRSLFVFPYRCVYSLTGKEDDVPVRCMMTVSKKRFRHAVDRNRGKRQMREAYRLNKHSLIECVEKTGQNLHVAFHFIGDKLESSQFMHKKMILLLNRLEQKIANEGKTGK